MGDITIVAGFATQLVTGEPHLGLSLNQPRKQWGYDGNIMEMEWAI